MNLLLIIACVIIVLALIVFPLIVSHKAEKIDSLKSEKEDKLSDNFTYGEFWSGDIKKGLHQKTMMRCVLLSIKYKLNKSDKIIFNILHQRVPGSYVALLNIGCIGGWDYELMIA